MKTGFVQSFKAIRKEQVPVVSYPQTPEVYSRGKIPMTFLAAAAGVYPADPFSFEQCSYLGMTLGYFAALQRYAGQCLNAVQSDFTGVKWTNEFGWDRFLRCRDDRGQSVAHVLATKGFLSEPDLIRASGVSDNHGWTVAHEYALHRTMPSGFFDDKDGDWSKWVDNNGRTVAQVAMVNGNLPVGFKHWTTSAEVEDFSLAHNYVEMEHRRGFFDASDAFPKTFPWGDDPVVWKHTGNSQEWSVAHAAASYGVLPDGLGDDILSLRGISEVSVREVQEEAKQLRKQLAKQHRKNLKKW